MRELLRDAWWVARKDLLLELRARTALISSFVFAALVLVIFNFARDPTAVPTSVLAPSILWVTFTFAAMLGLSRGFEVEVHTRAIDALVLSPIDRSSIYLGKFLSNLAFVALIEAVTLPLFGLFFNVNIVEPLLPLMGVTLLATVAFVAVGTLFSAMTVRTRFAQLMLPVLLLPFTVPPVTSAVQMTQHIFSGRPLSEAIGWVRLLAAYDVAFIVLGILLFEATLDE